MLTKDDLQAIKGIVKNEVDDSIARRVEPLLERRLKPIQKDLKYIRKTVDVIITSFDRRATNLEKKVKKIEEHLDLPTQN